MLLVHLLDRQPGRWNVLQPVYTHVNAMAHQVFVLLSALLLGHLHVSNMAAVVNNVRVL